MAVVLIAGCSSSAPRQPSTSSGATSFAGQPSPSETATEASAADETTPPQPVQFDPNTPEGQLTGPAHPLTLTSTLASEATVTQEIGPDGGTLSATGPDGTKFTLDIPPNVLPFAVAVTMSPTSSLSGFPTDATPEHAVGVELGPDGLELGLPATLTIELAESIDQVPVFALDYRTGGTNTGFHLLERNGSTLTLEVDHFSGYVATFPLQETEAQRLARELQEYEEWRLQSEIAQILSWTRFQQLFGQPPSIDNVAIAREYLPAFKELVLKPKVIAASQGCTQANAAMTALVNYERQRQVLGVGDDPTFSLKDDGWLIPPKLIDLATRLCFREAFNQCVADGNFPGLGLYFMSVFLRNSKLLDAEPTQAQINLAQGYLKRCGTYRLEVKDHWLELDPARFQVEVQTSLDFDLQWVPGDYAYGLVHSSIQGTGEIEVQKLRFASSDCPTEGYTINAHTTIPEAVGRIKDLEFDLVYGPTQSGVPLPPNPRKLTLEIAFGILNFNYTCNARNDKGIEPFIWVVQLTNRGSSELSSEFQSTAISLGSGWTFSVQPFKAIQTFHDILPNGVENFDTTVEVTLTNTPS